MDMNIRDITKLARKGRDGWIEIMQKNKIGVILADIINAQRLDNKRLAQRHDVDIEANRMTSDRACELVADVIEGDMEAFAEVMDKLQKQRDDILREALTEEEFEQYYKQREQSLEAIGDPEVQNQQEE